MRITGLRRQARTSLKINIAELILCKYEVLQYQGVKGVNQQVSEGKKNPDLTFFLDK